MNRINSDPAICSKYAMREKCTQSRNCQKVVTRHVWAEYMEKAEDYRHTPQYKKIFQTLRQEIEAGVYQDGEKLSSESELAARFTTSIITIKHALSLLSEEGLIRRVQGNGTFVTLTENEDAAAARKPMLIGVIMSGASDAFGSGFIFSVCEEARKFGCGVLLEGKILSGAMHTAGELGHTPIVWQGRPCGCGRRGCLEAYASGTAIWTQAMERFPEKLRALPQQTESVFRLAQEGDADALTLIHESVDKLAYGIAIGMDLLSVDTVIISGGICSQKELVIDPLPQKILQYGYPAWAATRTIRVLPARLGSNAPMVGAAFLTLDDMLLG